MAENSRDLAPRLGLFDATFVVVGAVIGSAIFLVPSTLIRANPSPLAAVLVMAFAGVLSFFGALAYSELGAMFPATGGEYVYLRESWGGLWAFLCGWAYFAVTQTGGIAAIAVGFGALLQSVVTMSEWQARLAPAALIVLLTGLNYLGIRVGATVNNLLSVLKLAGIGVMFIAVVAQPVVPAVDWSWPRQWSAAQFATALVPCLWAFEGWNFLAFVAGEIRRPERVIPRAMATGLGIVLLVYGVSMWIYFRSLTVAQIGTSQAVASDAALAALGSKGGALVSATMLISIAGCLNASIFSAPRVYFAMARDGVFFRDFADVHSKYLTPSKALLWQCVWGVLLAVSGSYDRLLSYCTFGAWIFYAMTVGGLFLLRRRLPDARRPYRMWGYPLSATCFLLVACGFVVSTLVSAPLTSLAGIGLIAAGLPLYFCFKRTEHPSSAVVHRSGTQAR